jgi:hypothetical protein
MSSTIDRATEAIHIFHQLQTFTGRGLTMMLNYEEKKYCLDSLFDILSIVCSTG